MKGYFLRHSFLSICLLLLVGMGAMAQTIRVSGTVVDEAGLGVIGAGVIQKGTTNGVATDIDGKFTINVPEGSVLEFSALNYVTQELPAKDGMVVVLAESAEFLDELVVVGYGVQRKSDLSIRLANENVPFTKEGYNDLGWTVRVTDDEAPAHHSFLRFSKF